MPGASNLLQAPGFLNSRRMGGRVNPRPLFFITPIHGRDPSGGCRRANRLFLPICHCSSMGVTLRAAVAVQIGCPADLSLLLHGRDPSGGLRPCTNSSGTNLDSEAGPEGANYMDVVCKSAILPNCLCAHHTIRIPWGIKPERRACLRILRSSIHTQATLLTFVCFSM